MADESTIFDESFSEAWDRFKDLLRACPHHGFSELHQLDTFYNALNVNDQDSLNSAAGGNFLDKRPADCSSIIESKSKFSTPEAKSIVAKEYKRFHPECLPMLAEFERYELELYFSKRQTSPVPAPAPVKVIEQSCVTCGVPTHIVIVRLPIATITEITSKNTLFGSSRSKFQTQGKFRLPSATDLAKPKQTTRFILPCNTNSQANNQKSLEPKQNQNRGMAIKSQMYQPPVNQHPAYQAPAHQASGVSKTDFESYVKANDAVMQNMQNQMSNITDLLTKIVNSNQASTSSSGSLPSNTIANPKGELKAITTRSRLDEMLGPCRSPVQHQSNATLVSEKLNLQRLPKLG
ncbi:hypothetical protein Tco_0862854 [Tanacetum coccineum]